MIQIELIRLQLELCSIETVILFEKEIHIQMANLYEIFYEHKELRRADIIAETKDEATQLLNEGDYENDDGKESLSKKLVSIDVVEEDI